MAQVQSAAEAANYLHVRNDWLARRKEPILEPDLPIVDPHHHLWDRPGWRYLLDDLLADINSGHNIVATVFVQARSMHRADGPEDLRPVGETEFVNGVAAMSASGIYGPARVCAGIVSYADLRLGAASRRCSRRNRAGGGRFRGIRHIAAWDADPTVRNPGNPAPPGCSRRDVPRGVRAARPARALVRRLALPPADRRADRARGRVPVDRDRAEPRRRPGRDRRLPARRGVPRLVGRDRGAASARTSW